MPLVWLALAVSVVAVVGATVLATLRAIDLFRAFRRLGSGVGAALLAVERSTARIEGHLAAASRSQASLERSLARLRESRAELGVLLAALGDARASVGRLTAFWPTK